VGLFGGGDLGARAAKFGFRFSDTFRKSVQFCAQNGDLVVNALQLNKVRDRRMHR